GGSSVPDGDGGGEDGLNDGGVEDYHHSRWQFELLHLPREVHPLLGFLGEGADGQLPLEVLCDDGAQEAEVLHSVDCGVTQDDGGGWGWVLPEVHCHLHCLYSVELQVVMSVPGHQMVSLPPVSGLILTRDESDEGGVVRELQELDGLMTGGAAVGVQGEEQRGKDAALWGSGADGPGVRDMLTQPHALPPVRQEVSDPPTGGVRHVQLGELVLQQSWDDWGPGVGW
ncbi:hypothetical protein LDENG_00117000, partial [Lucifuga dentata]